MIIITVRVTFHDKFKVTQRRHLSSQEETTTIGSHSELQSESTSCRSLSITHSSLVASVNITISDIPLKTRFYGLHFFRKKYRCIFNNFYRPRKLLNLVK